jgi:hypothetical protein
VLSGRVLCDELITRPEESYRLWRLVVCDLETSKEEAKSPLKGCVYKPTMGCDAEGEKKLSSQEFELRLSFQQFSFLIHYQCLDK